MKNFAIALLLVLQTTWICSLKAQNLDVIQQKLADYALTYPQEKLHLQTDRSVYGAGETIWYKVYSVIGWENRLSILSNIGYVELIDPQGKVNQKKINAIFSGVAVGDIVLPDTLSEGSYRLRAYTNWMRNSETDYFFEKVINIGNVRGDNVITNSSTISDEGTEFYVVQLQSTGSTPWPKTVVQYEFKDGEKVVDKGRETLDPSGQIRIKVNEKNKGKLLTLNFQNPEKRKVRKFIHTQVYFSENSVQLLPEGGSLLADELNKIAIKALNPQGRGIKAKVDILSSAKEVVATVETNELGMGSVPCYIAKDQTYTAHVVFADKTEKTIPLPEITNSGYNVSVNQANSSKIYTQVNITSDKINGEDIYLVLQHLGNVHYIAKQKASTKNVLFSLSKEQLPSGIITISILNKDFLPLVERPIFYLNPNRLLQLQVQQDKPSYGKRQKVTNNVEVGDASDSIRLASLSASVINLTKYGKDLSDDISILSSLFLNADLKGFVEKPAYYFNEDGTVKTLELDNLLLTQGWRKIDWTKLDSLAKKPEYEAEKGIKIKGQTRKLARKAAFPNARVQLISTKNFMDYIDTTSNEQGYFAFDDIIFPDSVKFLISAKDEKGKNNIDITVDSVVSPLLNIAKNEPLIRNDVNEKFREQLLAGKRFYQQLENKGLMDKVNTIEEIVVTAKRPKASETSSNMNGPGNADQVLSAEDLSTCSTLEMCLNGRLTGVMFQGGKAINMRGMGEMQIVLDGMYVEADMLSTIIPQDVQSVEVLRNINYTSIYGSYGANGLIIITSKTGRDASRGNFKPKGLLAIQPKGISLLKEFYKPVYEPDSQTQFEQDLRTTIHWEPGIVTNEQGKASFDFYTSDEVGTYRMIIEGIDFDGRIQRKVIDFEVK